MSCLKGEVLTLTETIWLVHFLELHIEISTAGTQAGHWSLSKRASALTVRRRCSRSMFVESFFHRRPSARIALSKPIWIVRSHSMACHNVILIVTKHHRCLKQAIAWFLIAHLFTRITTCCPAAQQDDQPALLRTLLLPAHAGLEPHRNGAKRGQHI